jgi:hypothetical protein
LFFQLAIHFCVSAQFVSDSLKKNIDSLPGTDSTRHAKDSSLIKDSTHKLFTLDTSWKLIVRGVDNNFIHRVYEQNSFFGFLANRNRIRSDKKNFQGKEALFYTLIAILLLFAFFRLAFPKYITDIFRVTFRTTVKQRQIGEQLTQASLPSLMLNVFFFITASLYIDFLIQHYHVLTRYDFWILYLYCFAAVAFIYLIKFLSLKFSGWLFNISEITNAYTFTIFLINKIIGIFLLPILVLFAFAGKDVFQIALNLSFAGIFGLLAYRFLLSYGLVRNSIKVNGFHFFLYLCAFEIVPLLLIYKLLLQWF